ncbi:MAG: HAD-IA family hydrolase [Candidatus Woesearchaeota archaeon]
MAPKKISTIVFDFDGVLSADNTEDILRRSSLPVDGALLYNRMIASRPFYECMKGRISFTEFKTSLAGIADTSPEVAEEIVRSIIEERGISHSVLNVVRRLKDAGYILVLHSDMMKVPFDAWTRKFSLKDNFDHLICSAYMGTLKNDPETYDKVLSFLETAPEEVLYVDDSKANIYTAKAKGMHGIVFRSAETLLVELGKMGLLSS